MNEEECPRFVFGILVGLIVGVGIVMAAIICSSNFDRDSFQKDAIRYGYAEYDENNQWKWRDVE